MESSRNKNRVELNPTLGLVTCSLVGWIGGVVLVFDRGQRRQSGLGTERTA